MDLYKTNRFYDELHLYPGLSVPHVSDGLGTDTEHFCNEGTLPGDRFGMRPSSCC
jgi:hypothetical protein